jgi:ADP-heptose:LPS heptosyltransferase
MSHTIKPLQRILVIRRDNIGDLICTLPLINNLRENYPLAQIDLLVNSYNQQTIEQQPEIDTVYAYTKAKHRVEGQSKLQVYWQRLLLLLRLRHKHYDLSILAGSRFSNHALKLAKFVNAKQIMAVVPASSSLNCIDLSIPESLDTNLHEAEHCLALLPLLGIEANPMIAANLYANPTGIKNWQTYLTEQPLYQKSCLTIGIHMSARKPSQRWSETNFID